MSWPHAARAGSIGGVRSAMAAVLLTLAAGLAAAPAAHADRTGDRVVRWGLAQVGTHEDGTSNCTARIDR